MTYARTRAHAYKHTNTESGHKQAHGNIHIIAGMHSLAIKDTQTHTVMHTSLADTYRHTVMYIRMHLRVPPWHQIALNAGSPLAGCVKMQ